MRGDVLVDAVGPDGPAPGVLDDEKLDGNVADCAVGVNDAMLQLAFGPGIGRVDRFFNFFSDHPAIVGMDEAEAYSADDMTYPPTTSAVVRKNSVKIIV